MSPLLYLGNTCIGLAVAFALFGAICFFAGRRSSSSAASGLGRASAYGLFLVMTVANLAMVYALLRDDFQVSYVAHVGSRETPRGISAISLWSSLEGSILLWGWVLSAYTALCLYRGRRSDARLMPWVGMTLLVVQLFFALLLAIPANPFQPVIPPPDNGPGPNPLLQNHWLMAVHPPCLYLGYIGLTVPFAFAIAGLLEVDLAGRWLALSRRWLLFAWSFLSIAIVLGGWWSYAVLGWGGYWAWDPVENASFMPWLSATALIHSAMVQERKKMLAVWNIALAILTFLLTLLGTFLTRSGILDSVHSFTESHVGPYFLTFIGIVLAVSLTLLLWRGPRFPRPTRIERLFSLEVLFLFNNLLFLGFCFVVFLGTLYPLVVEAIRGTRISVGEPYFNQMTVPIVGMILFLMSLGVMTPWGRSSASGLWAAARTPLALSFMTSAVSFFLGGRGPLVVLVVFLCSLAFFVMAREFLVTSWRRAAGSPKVFFPSFIALFSENPRRYGGFVAHTGVLMIVVAVTLSSTYEREEELSLARGESVTLGDYTLTLEKVGAEETGQRFEVRASVGVEREGRSLGRLVPQMNFYPNSREPIGSPAVRSTPVEDLYLTLVHFAEDGSSAAIQAIVSPAVVWIWIGGGVVLLGGLLSAFLKRRRKDDVP